MVSFKRYFSPAKIFSPAKMASFAGVEVFLGFKHPLELKDLSAGERRSHLLPARLPIWSKLEKNIDIFFNFESDTYQELKVFKGSPSGPSWRKNIFV